MTGGRDDFGAELAFDPSRASVSEMRWFFCLHNYLADIGRDQHLADALIQSGMTEENAINFMRAMLRLSVTARPKTGAPS
jgi:hypothetical membrane protein